MSGRTQKRREPILTFPNLLTLLRIPLAAIIWLAPRRPGILIPVMAVAAASDILDGRVARMIRARREKSGKDSGQLAEAGAVGAWLDPLCDKLFVASLLAAVYVNHEPPLAVIAMIATRELLLFPLFLVYKLGPRLGLVRSYRMDFRAGLVGKLATAAQFAAVAAILVGPDQVYFLAVVAATTGVLAVFEYTWRAAHSPAVSCPTSNDV